MPKPLIKVLLAAHIGTGCDSLSKVGTKLAALNAIPEMFLEGFGTRELDEIQIKKCEEYLVKVFKLTTDCKTFDSLRSVLYKINDSIFDLPPSSYSITQGHIPRWYFLVKESSNLLNPNYHPLDPCDYQWANEDGELLPIKNLLLLPEELAVTCHCKGNDVSKRCSRCSCVKKGSICTEYCSCGSSCSNTSSSSRQPKRKKSTKSMRRTRQKTD